MTLSKEKRQAIRMMFGGHCAYCGCILSEKRWHVDHVKAVKRQLRFAHDKNNRTIMVSTGRLFRPENNCEENLFPACAPCNIDKGSIPLEDWREYLEQRIVDGLRRNSSTFRHAERFGRVLIAPGPLVFWFEKYRTPELPS
jgi:hypothetical protein